MSDSSAAAASAPKKLKLTLKLSSSSSSSTSPASTPAASLPNSSLPSSPVKIVDEITSTTTPATVVPLSDLPSGLGNLKGRGRPKKAAAPKTTVESVVNSTSSSAQPSNPSTTTTTPAPIPNEYAADLKSFVASMNTFKPRSWSLNRPISLDIKNVAGYSVELDCGLWCTVNSEPGSAHLRSSEIQTTMNTTTSALSAATGSKDSVDITCQQCGKVFNTQSKYKKHLKTHEKPVDASLTTQTPTISLKIKLTTSNNNHNKNVL